MKHNPVQLTSVDNILSSSSRNLLGSPERKSNQLMTFEELDQNSGFVLYETTLPKLTRDPSQLTINDLRDRAQVYVDEVRIVTLDDKTC